MQRFFLSAIALGTGLVALMTIGLYFYERPTYLRIAVPRGGESQKLITALNQELVRTRADLRFHLVSTNDLPAAAKLMEEGRVDLAVVRSDLAMPTNAATALILAHQIAVILAPHGASYANVSDLKGKSVAVVTTELSGEANKRLLDTIEAQYSLPADSINKRPVELANLPELLRSGDIDAVLAFGAFDSPQLTEVVQILSHSVSPPDAPEFIPIRESNAIAKRFPGIESTEILRGAFGGAPSRPAENIETIGATVRLVARSDLSNSTVGDVTSLILANRAAAAGAAPLANHIEAPETDKGEALPTHPGAAAFLDDEEESFFDKYSDLFYISAMIGSVLISGVATLASRMTVRGYARFDQLMEEALMILKAGREAIDTAALAKLELEIDAILTQSLAAAETPKLDGHQLAALTLAVQQARLAIADRRAELAKRGTAFITEAPPRSSAFDI
jgi:TRAP-type uncharacterized transport system substrate-binding protein